MTLADAPEALRVEQVAELLQIGRGTAYEAIRTGEIPSVRVGRCIRVPRVALERMMLTAAGTDSPQRNGAGETAPQQEESSNHGNRTPEPGSG